MPSQPAGLRKQAGFFSRACMNARPNRCYSPASLPTIRTAVRSRDVRGRYAQGCMIGVMVATGTPTGAAAADVEGDGTQTRVRRTVVAEAVVLA
jgi:hypothetical protein